MEIVSEKEAVPFVIYANFESFFSPNFVTSLKNAAQTHIPSSFCGLFVSKFEELKFEPLVYSGDEVMRHYYDFLMNEKTMMDKILNRNESVKPMTALEQKSQDEAVTCFKRDKQSCENNMKTRHHCHVTDEHLGSACSNCNLQLKPRRLSGHFGTVPAEKQT
jgi:hypothetical protein